MENPLDSMICPRGLSHPQRIYAPERIQYPMRRVEGTARGAGEWERLTWDEAIEEISTKWKGYLDEFGPNSIGFIYCAGSNSYNPFVYQMLKNAFGGFSWEVPADMAALNMGKDAFGRSDYLVGNDTHDIENAKYIFNWGCNFTTCNLAKVRMLWKARENGAKIIVIDPNWNDTAAKADMFVPIRPGTDAALAMAMTKIIIDEGLADEDYMIKNSVAPFLARDDNGRFLEPVDVGIELEFTTDQATGQQVGPTDEYGRPINYVVMGEDGDFNTPDRISSPVLTGSFTVNGISCQTAYQKLIDRVSEWTPERASELCGIPVDTIRELALMYAEGPTYLALGFGNDHWGNGDTITQAQFALLIVSGQIGKPGAGVGANNGGGTTGIATVNWMGTMYPPEPVFTGLSSMIEYLPEVIETGMYGDTPVTPKSMLSYSNNFLATCCDRNLLIECLDQIELLICCETVMNDTARYSDIVLPVPHWFEYETAMSCTTKYLRFNDKAVEPLYESKSDVEIVHLIGTAMGFKGFDTLTNESFHQGVFDNDYCRENGLTWDAVKEKKDIVWAHDPWIYGNIDEGTVFMNTPKRAAFYLDNPTPLHAESGATIDADRLRLPSFELPIEAWPQTIGEFEKNPLSEKYPLTIITYRDKFKVHSTFALTPQFLEIQPEPTIELCPADAEARGISEGDYVRAYNDRGYMVAKAHIDASMYPGMVRTEHGWLAEQYVDGAQNSLTSNAIRHHKPTAEHFDCLCEIEKQKA